MGFDSSWRRDIVEMSQASQDGDMLRTFGSKSSHVEKVVREAKVEVITRLDLGNVFWR